ncbi:MAG TPA: alpha/beta hydrolase [Pyrinomonadaceae bacterium]|jgi:cephalosporin-C deacetylase-like acetyl esterase
MKTNETVEVELRGAEEKAGLEKIEDLALKTDSGTIRCRLHAARSGEAAILWVFGSGGGLGGPAGGVYERLANEFISFTVSSLQLDYRRPGHLKSCVEDVLIGVDYLASLGKKKIALVGHSFGGAVVISAGILSPTVAAVAALSSQTSGAENAAALAPKPLLLIHGADDEILPASCSQHIYKQAREPKELILYEGCRHGLDRCRDELDRDLTNWLKGVFEIEEPTV